MKAENLREWLSVYLKGVAMGCAHAIPGISGGTIALITGIYGRLISAITSIHPRELSRLREDFTGFSDVIDALYRLDFFFLMVLGAGILTSVITVLNAVNYLVINHPVPTYGALTGLIAASAIVLIGEVDLRGRRAQSSALAGFVLSFLASGYLGASVSTSMPVLFVSGVLAVSALILPGISGSLVLVILGQYTYLSKAVSDSTDAAVSLLSGDVSGIVETAPPLLVFLSGATVGILTVSHLVKKALENYREVTVAFLVSLVVGGLNAPISETGRILAEKGVTWSTAAPGFTAAALIGAVALFLLNRLTSGIEIE